MSGINRDGVLKLAEVILDAADAFREVLSPETEPEESEAPVGKESVDNKFDSYPAGTVVSTVIATGTDAESTFLHVKREDARWNELVISVKPGTNKIEVYRGGALSSDALVGFDEMDIWNLTVLTDEGE